MIKVSVNDTTNTLSKRIIFGSNKTPQSEFNYRNMALPVGSDQYEEYVKKFGDDYKFRVFDSEGLPQYRDYIPGEVLPEGWSILPFFPGYEFGFSKRSEYYNEEVTERVGLGKSLYLGEVIGEGGRVYSEPGMYAWVWDGDISSQHPHSIIAERLFGPRYTKIFEGIVKCRVAIKHKDFETAGNLLNGALKPYLSSEGAAGLAQALKIVINSIYGLTKAGFKNEFRDDRNEDNIVAKRGALFMTLLKREVQKRGYQVCHIKTDSIKIPNATDEIKDFVVKFGREYGYEFETEGVFVKFCLLNDAAYIAKTEDGKYIAKASQFNESKSPFVYKTLFSKEPILFKDMCETMSVQQGALYLDMNEDLGEPVDDELDKAIKKLKKMVDKQAEKSAISEQEMLVERLSDEAPTHHDLQFVGRVGLFTPIVKGGGGGVLYRVQDGKRYAATGTTGYRWLEAENVLAYGKENLIDKSYYISKVNEAIDDINAVCKDKDHSYDWFVSDIMPPKPLPEFMNLPETDEEEVELPWDPIKLKRGS